LAKGFKGFLHLRVVDVRIDHRRGEIRMAEHHLTFLGLRSIMWSEVAA